MRMLESAGEIPVAAGVTLYYEAVGDGPGLLVVPNGVVLREDLAPLAAARRLLLYDPRNRGRSSAIRDPSLLVRGIHHDADDLEVVRQWLGVERLDLLGFSYAATTVALYALAQPSRVGRLVQVGPMAPTGGTSYPAHLAADDGVFAAVMAELAALEPQRATCGPERFCRQVWAILGRLYVVDPADSPGTRWGRCHLANERAARRHWLTSLQPSLTALDLGAAALATLTAPVLVVHGRRDRSSPYGAGRDWALRLPRARLLTVPDAGHAPWIEAPDLVYGSIASFLAGDWPVAAERVRTLEP